jgi:hypothetical protein
MLAKCSKSSLDVLWDLSSKMLVKMELIPER